MRVFYALLVLLPICAAVKTCEEQRKEAMDNLHKGLMGVTIPSCTKNGDWAPVQCDDGGYCFCVTPKGEKVDGTSVRGTPDCPVPRDPTMTECQAAAKKSQDAMAKGMIGGFVPQCDSNGDFDAVQCSGSTGFCWCVDTKTGDKIEGSSVRGEPKCTKTKPATECQTKAKAAQAEVAKGMIGGFVPRCDDNGDYSKIQCSGSTGMCWCANTKTGVEIEGTATRSPTPNCDEMNVEFKPTPKPKLLTCAEKRKAQLDNVHDMIGSFVPECDEEGNYKAVQCDASTGFCWCADTETGIRVGKEIRGTPKCGDSEPQMEIPKKETVEVAATCASTRKQALDDVHDMIGKFIPECDEEGNYKPVQCDASTGFCWCACTKTGKKIDGTSVRGTPKCPAKKDKKEWSCNDARKKATSDIDQMLSAKEYIPVCDKKGNYQPLQCDLQGYCWCANPKTGAAIAGTKGRDVPNCSDDIIGEVERNWHSAIHDKFTFIAGGVGFLLGMIVCAIINKCCCSTKKQYPRAQQLHQPILLSNVDQKAIAKAQYSQKGYTRV